MLLATKLLSLCFLGIIMLEETTPGHALVRRYKFELRHTSHTRLCTNTTMLTINGQFPGPTVYAERGDVVIIDVFNRADQNITIHLHGVKNPRNPWSDGPEYVTQCPISPGTRFTQRIFLSDEEGTLWWHAHYHWSRHSVFGAVVISPPANETYPFPKPHAEVPILVGEWWKADMQKLFEVFHWGGGEPELSDAFHINGLPGDLYPCSKQDHTFKLSVESGKTYLFKLINAVMDNVMVFRIANHNFTVVGTDGAYTKPFRSDCIVIAPGQTIDFLMEANQPPSRYYMASRVTYVTGGDFNNGTTTGYVEYVGSYTPPESPPLPRLPAFNNSVLFHNFTGQFRSLGSSVDVPMNVTENLFYTLSVNIQPCVKTNCTGPFGEHLRSSVNNLTMFLPEVSFLEAYYHGIKGVYSTNFPDHPPRVFDYTHSEMIRQQSRTDDVTGVRILEYNTEVEVVFQGTDLATGVDHPMHLHGHSFYVVGWGFGNFDRSRDPANYNLLDPPFMETVTVPRQGWLAARFKANNPGVWLLHCHFERHVTWGMEVVFIVKDGKLPHQKMLPPPSDMPRC